jgi:hypothetical protein
MTSYDQRSLELGRWRQRRPRPRPFAELRQLAERLWAARGGGEPDSQPTVATARLPGEAAGAGDEPRPRFPLARHGYDRLAVDRCVEQLERELAELDRELVELRTRTDAPEQVANEIRRVGEQTSAVLVAAHQQREKMLRDAQLEADRLVGEARANAASITARAEARVRELEAQNDAARRERERLLEDFRTVASGLEAVVGAAEERIPAG